ncbi:DUF308 domain-containing protein, partial [Rhodococcus electrodiphilus]|uniref:DUF308 domain-containing protein n=1 Tax=Rhodococcus ruber TaxID=1830 RepID=UPI0026F46534
MPATGPHRRARAATAALRTAPWWTSVLLGLVCLLLGLLLTTRPLTSLSALGLLIGLAAITAGAADLLAAHRSHAGAAAIATALAWIGFGIVVLAWRWPDVTVLVVAFLFGIRTVFFGLTRIGDGLALDDRTPG